LIMNLICLDTIIYIYLLKKSSADSSTRSRSFAVDRYSRTYNIRGGADSIVNITTSDGPELSDEDQLQGEFTQA